MSGEGRGAHRRGFVFVNGRLVAASRASVSVFDRGLQYGDGLFETLRAYRGFPFALDLHLDRLRASARFFEIPFPEQDWAARIAMLLRRNRLLDQDAWIRILVTRGEAEPALEPPAHPSPTCIIMAKGVAPQVASRQRHGVSLITLPFDRGGSLAEHKSLNYLAGIMGKVLARRSGADEGVYVGPRGQLREGTTSSVFVVCDGQLSTVPTRGILSGVTRRLVLDLATREGIPTRETRLMVADLLRADEILLTSSVAEIVPVIEVCGRPVGTGRAGPITRRLQRLYRAAVRRARSPRTLGA